MRLKNLYLAGFALHFFLLCVAASRDFFSVLKEGGNLLPPFCESLPQKAERLATEALGERLPDTNAFRQLVALYTNAAGTEAGYGFFSPNVPDSYKLVFELEYPDARIEYEEPRVSGSAAGFRLTSLYDNLGQVHDDLLREVSLKMLAYATWREHRDAIRIRAVFGAIDLPSLEEAAHGKKETYRPLYAYDFRFHAPPPSSLEAP